jgi:hypothetical protein
VILGFLLLLRISLLLFTLRASVKKSLSHLSVAFLGGTPPTVSLAQPIEILLEFKAGVRNQKRADVIL